MLALALASSLTLVLTDVQRLPLDRGAVETATEAALHGSGLELRWGARGMSPPKAGRGSCRPSEHRVTRRREAYERGHLTCRGVVPPPSKCFSNSGRSHTRQYGPGHDRRIRARLSFTARRLRTTRSRLLRVRCAVSRLAG